MNLSATIITYNEEKNIARAIKSLNFVNEITVIDSGSSDQTVKIARELGARVFHNPFAGYGQQKNFAASKAEHNWILSIDADEEVSNELKESLLKNLQSLDETMVYYVNRRTNFCQKWIYHGGWYPDILARIYNKKSARWTEPHVHEELIANSPSTKKIIIKGHLNHYSFPSCKSQIETNIKYAKLGSQSFKRRPSFFKVLTKPVGKFIECYLIKRGVLDGKAGLIIALNASYSIFMKYLFAWNHHD